MAWNFYSGLLRACISYCNVSRIFWELEVGFVWAWCLLKLDDYANYDELLAAGDRHLNDNEQLYLKLLEHGECMFLVLEKRYAPTQ